MPQRLLRRCLPDRIQRPGAKRSARRGQNHPSHVFATPGTHRLKQRIMFAVDRQNSCARCRRAAHEQCAGADEAFLVGERDGGAPPDRSHCRLQADRAGDRRHHPIGGIKCRFDQRRFTGGGLDAGAGQCIFQRGITIRIGNHGDAGADIARDLRQSRHIAPGGDAFDAVKRRIALDQIDGAGADRTGGAEDGDAARRGAR